VRVDGAMRDYYVYILSNHSRILYTGFTSNLISRIQKHKQKLYDGFTKKYNVTQLVWYETTTDVRAAIEREKEIKAWRRSKRVELIRRMNPTWRDLSDDFD
jgi:putative endonuclease